MVTHVGGKPFTCEMCNKVNLPGELVHSGVDLIYQHCCCCGTKVSLLAICSSLGLAEGKIVQRQSPLGKDRSVTRDGLWLQSATYLPIKTLSNVIHSSFQPPGSVGIKIITLQIACLGGNVCGSTLLLGKKNSLQKETCSE